MVLFQVKNLNFFFWNYIFASGGQGALLKNCPLHPRKTFVERYVFCPEKRLLLAPCAVPRGLKTTNCHCWIDDSRNFQTILF